ncbi:MAG: hypothetical protein ACTSU5_19000 [Promethearchaeota archaeon]
MSWDALRGATRTRAFKAVVTVAAAYAAGAVYFFGWIYGDASKQPGDPANWFRDLTWVVYWRWNLDSVIVGTFTSLVLLETFVYRKAVASGRVSRETLSVYISPAVTMGSAFIYMLAIDLGVTYMGDTGFNGTWESTRVIWLGMTARELYHDFFFWFVPAVVICGVTNQVAIHTGSYRQTLKAFCVLMAVYSLDLGFLDPLVCHVLWGDWRIFGEWAMGGADAIFAEGWIVHYCVLAVAWLAGSKIVDDLSRAARGRMTPAGTPGAKI